MNMDLLCVLAVWFTNVLLLVILLFTLLKLNKSINEKIKMDNMRFNFEVQLKEDDFLILDNLIQENLAQYCVLKVENIDKLYVSEDMQHKMFEYVLRQVMYQLSPMYLQRLYYIYNKDKIDDVITQKINQAILAYSVEVNSNYRS